MISSSVGDIEQGIISHNNGEDSDEESVGCSYEESSSNDSSSCTRVVVKDDEVSNGRRINEKNRSSSSSSSSSCLSECSVEEVMDLETKVNVHLSKVERDCRICHLSLDGSNPESGFPIELGCSCKEDLAAAHKHCAEAWFKIRGNKTCEICGSTARNVVGVNEVELTEQWNEANDNSTATAAPPHPAETRHFWQGHRFLNFLLACMVFAFVISWLFHFNVPS
ncbi:unnamed protein product [Amaranthus hypochondriacus]